MAPETRSRGHPQKTAGATPAETTAATTPATAATNSENNAQSQKKGRGRPRKPPLEDNPPSSDAAAADSAPARSSTRAKRGQTAATTTTSAPADTEDAVEEPPKKKLGRPKKDSSDQSKVDATVAAAVDRAKAEKEKEKENAKQKALKLKEKEKLKKQRDKEKEKEKKLKEKEKAKRQKEKEREREKAKKLKEKEKEKMLKEKEKEKAKKQRERDMFSKAEAKEDVRKQKVKEGAAERAAKRSREESPPPSPDGHGSGSVSSDVSLPGYESPPQGKKSNKRKKTIRLQVNADDDVSEAAVQRALTALAQKKEKKTNRPNADDDDEDDDEWAEDEAENLGMNLPREIMIGQYKLRCAEVEDQWPDDAKRLKMAIMTHKTVDAAGVGLIASFNLGIVEGTMLLAGSVEAVQKIRNQISNDVLIPIKRPNFDIDGERPEDYEPRHNRLFIRWRGRETGEGSVSTDNYYDKNNGYIDFITPQEGSQDKVKIKGIIDDVEGIGGPLTFEGERVKDSGGKKPFTWNTLGESDAVSYEGPGMIVF